jgi:hypothetical protein
MANPASGKEAVRHWRQLLGMAASSGDPVDGIRVFGFLRWLPDIFLTPCFLGCSNADQHAKTTLSSDLAA